MSCLIIQPHIIRPYHGFIHIIWSHPISSEIPPKKTSLCHPSCSTFFSSAFPGSLIKFLRCFSSLSQEQIAKQSDICALRFWKGNNNPQEIECFAFFRILIQFCRFEQIAIPRVKEQSQLASCKDSLLQSGEPGFMVRVSEAKFPLIPCDYSRTPGSLSMLGILEDGWSGGSDSLVMGYQCRDRVNPWSCSSLNPNGSKQKKAGCTQPQITMKTVLKLKKEEVKM